MGPIFVLKMNLGPLVALRIWRSLLKASLGGTTRLKYDERLTFVSSITQYAIWFASRISVLNFK
jgi:hypothetical protein